MEDEQKTITPKKESLLDAIDDVFDKVLTENQKWFIFVFICLFIISFVIFATNSYFRGKSIDRQIKYIDQLETSKQEMKDSLELSKTECSLLKDLRKIDEKMNKLEMELKDKEIKTLKDMIEILGYLSQINNFIPDKIDPNSMSKI